MKFFTQAVLTVKSICDDFVNEEVDVNDRELVYEDEDDSNDESNWRNDYPDEDPCFFENDDADCYYAEGMRLFLFCSQDIVHP